MRLIHRTAYKISLFALIVCSVAVFSVVTGPQLFAAKSAQDSELSGWDFVRSPAGELFQAGEYERALTAIESMLVEYPGDPLLERYKAICLDRLGQSEKAIQIFESLLRDEPTHMPTQFFLGQAYERQGDLKAAKREFNRVMNAQDGSPYVAWSREALMRLGAPISGLTTQEILRWNLNLRYGYEYDTNVSIRPDDKSLASPGDINAGRQTLDMTLRYRAISRRDLAVDLFFASRHSFNDDGLNEFNFHSEEWGVSARKKVQIGNQDVVLGGRYEVLLGFQDDELFSVRNRFLISADTRFTAQTRTVFLNRLTVAEFGQDGTDPSFTSRDGLYHDIGVIQYFYSEDFRKYLFLREEFHTSYTRGDNFDTVGTTTRVGGHLPLMPQLDWDGSVGLRMGFYHNFSSQSTRDSSRRRDFRWDLYTAFTYHVTPQIGIRTFYRYMNQRNQNNFFDYKRHVSGAQVIYSRLF